MCPQVVDGDFYKLAEVSLREVALTGRSTNGEYGAWIWRFHNLEDR